MIIKYKRKERFLDNEIFVKIQLRRNVKRQFHSDAMNACSTLRVCDGHHVAVHTTERKLRYFVDDVYACERGGILRVTYATQRERRYTSVIVHMRRDGDSKRPPHPLLAKLRHSGQRKSRNFVDQHFVARARFRQWDFEYLHLRSSWTKFC